MTVRFTVEPQLINAKIEHNAAPPNMALQRTCRIVTRFAYAKPAPTRQSAELGCQTAMMRTREGQGGRIATLVNSEP
jgi:hypothetical protein